MNKKLLLERLAQMDVQGLDTVALYNQISSTVMEFAEQDISAPALKNAYYLSMEFLIGRSFYNNLMELGILEEVREILQKKGIDINIFEEIEDAALGNGGLGRLAACFLDSAAGLGVPLYGYGIRFRYGLFKQAIENGFQVEVPDDWQRFGDPWSIRREKEKRIIRFADMEVVAVPYDMPIFGKRTNVLRLFQAEGSEEAEAISAYLYPADDTEKGKLLRLRQEYFFSAAAIDELIERFVASHGKNFERFSQFHSIQLNDTHPVLAIAEFIRVLTATYRVSFSDALKYARQTFAYTNHTILPEALECWREESVRKILPDIANIIVKISVHQRNDMKMRNCSLSERREMSIIGKQGFSMANLAVYASKAVNGVAQLHTEILKNSLFHTAYRYSPEKFYNETNGITQRRWLMLCNRELASLIDGAISSSWREDITRLSQLKERVPALIDDFIAVKQEKKRQLFAYIKQHEHVEIPPHFVVYAQVKRLHEYKRQLMTAFAIIEIYHKLKNGELPDFQPSVFLFGAKSAPSYHRAKGIIKFINEIAARVNTDAQTNKLMRVVFVQNYNVSYAEKIVAAADVSLQVSTAGLEASGTGNMKFMMNGAVTCGTMDGANIEIVEHAGMENNYIFGARVDEIDALKKAGYQPEAYLLKDPLHKVALETLIDGTFDDGNTGYFQELYNSLTVGASWHAPDQYFIFRDLGEYVSTLLEINRDYHNAQTFARKQLMNVASSAFFSSDRTISGYVKDIWKVN